MLRQFFGKFIASVIAFVCCFTANAQSVPDTPRLVPLDVRGQLSAIARQDSASDTLPADRLREFSTHSHMTYETTPRVIQVPRLSPEAHAPTNFVPLH